MKTILATGELGTLRNVARASLVCHDGGRRLHQDLDRQGEASTPPCPSSLVMVRAIREYHERTGYRGRLQAGRRHPHRQAGARTGWP